MNICLFASVENVWLLAGWTMIHFLWLGTLVALAGPLSRWLLRRTSANVRYTSALICLATLAALPIAIAAWLHAYSPSVEAADRQLQNNTTNQVAKTEQGGAVELKKFESTPLAIPSTIENGGAPTSAQSTAPAAQPTDLTVAGPLPATSAPMATDPFPLVVFAINFSVRYLPWLWLIGTPLTFALTATGLLGARRLHRASRSITDGPIAEALEKLAASLRLSRRVAVAVCDRIAAPVLIGILRPIILLPPAALTGYSADEIEMVLLHELAHVRRWDNLANFIQRLIESFLFFHPAVWLVSSWVRREREECCDALVVTRTDRPHAYAELLVALAAQMPRSVLFHPAASSAMAAAPLRSRIKRILKLDEDPMLISGKSFAVVLAALLLTATFTVLYLPAIGQAEQTITKTSEDRENTKSVDSKRDTESQAKKTQDNLKRIASAMLAYRDRNDAEKRLPPHAFYDLHTPLLSWRVQILPWLGEAKLYGEFHLWEPWNSEHNRMLIARMPDAFKSPKVDKPGMTNYLAVVGKQCVFDGSPKGLSLKQIADGTARTIAIVEANADLAVEWTKPQDWNFDRGQPTKGLGQLWPGRWYAAWVDGSVHGVENREPADRIGIQFTRAGGETKSLAESANRSATEFAGAEGAPSDVIDAALAGVPGGPATGEATELSPQAVVIDGHALAKTGSVDAETELLLREITDIQKKKREIESQLHQAQTDYAGMKREFADPELQKPNATRQFDKEFEIRFTELKQQLANAQRSLDEHLKKLKDRATTSAEAESRDLAMSNATDQSSQRKLPALELRKRTDDWPAGVAFASPEEAEIAKRAWRQWAIKIVPTTQAERGASASECKLKVVSTGSVPTTSLLFLTSLNNVPTTTFGQLANALGSLKEIKVVLAECARRSPHGFARTLIALDGTDNPAIEESGDSNPATAKASARFPSLEDQKQADLVWKRLKLEVTQIGPVDLKRVKALGYDGGMRLTNTDYAKNSLAQGSISDDDILVGLHAWPTRNIKEIVDILSRPDLSELSPLKFYVIRREQIGAVGNNEPTAIYDDVVQTGRINVNLGGDGSGVSGNKPRSDPQKNSNQPTSSSPANVEGTKTASQDLLALDSQQETLTKQLESPKSKDTDAEVVQRMHNRRYEQLKLEYERAAAFVKQAADKQRESAKSNDAAARDAQHDLDRRFEQANRDFEAAKRKLEQAQEHITPQLVAAENAIAAETTTKAGQPANGNDAAKTQPKTSQFVYAQIDGVIKSVKVAYGDIVHKNDVLLVLESPKLDNEMESVHRQLQQALAIVRLNTPKSDSKENLSDVEKKEKEHELAPIKESISSYQKQLDLLNAKKAMLEIPSPIDGRVVTPNVEERLLERPVNRGEKLLEIADSTEDLKRDALVGTAALPKTEPVKVTLELDPSVVKDQAPVPVQPAQPTQSTSTSWRDRKKVAPAETLFVAYDISPNLKDEVQKYFRKTGARSMADERGHSYIVQSNSAWHDNFSALLKATPKWRDPVAAEERAAAPIVRKQVGNEDTLEWRSVGLTFKPIGKSRSLGPTSEAYLAVSEVAPGSPAAWADIQPGDVLTDIGNFNARTMPEVQALLKALGEGLQSKKDVRVMFVRETPSKATTIVADFTIGPEDLGPKPAGSQSSKSVANGASQSTAPSERLKVYFFYTPDAQPATETRPILKTVVDVYPGVSLVEVDVSQASDQARKFKVDKVPTCVLTRYGQEVSRVVGAQTKLELATAIQSALTAPVSEPIKTAEDGVIGVLNRDPKTKEPGGVVQLAVKEGTQVKAGQVIGKIDDSEPQMKKDLFVSANPSSQGRGDVKGEKSTLRYEGKSFEGWKSAWQIELSTEKRIEMVKALATFGANGYGKEAAEAIIEIAGRYDWTSTTPNTVLDPLRAACVEAFGGEGAKSAIAQSIPANEALPALTAAAKSGTGQQKLFISRVLPGISGPESITARLMLSKDQDSLVRKKALQTLPQLASSAHNDKVAARIREALASNDPDDVVAAMFVIVPYPNTPAAKSPYPYLPELIKTLYSPHEVVRKHARELLRLIKGDDAARVTNETLAVLKDDSKKDQRIEAIRVLAALGPNAKSAVDTLRPIAMSNDQLQAVAATAALKRIFLNASDYVKLLDESHGKRSNQEEFFAFQAAVDGEQKQLFP